MKFNLKGTSKKSCHDAGFFFETIHEKTPKDLRSFEVWLPTFSN